MGISNEKTSALLTSIGWWAAAGTDAELTREQRRVFECVYLDGLRFEAALLADNAAFFI